MKRLLLSLMASSFLTACATSQSTPTAASSEIEAAPASARPAVEPLAPVPAPAGSRQQRGRKLASLQVISQANSAARQRPMPDAFNQARHIFTYQAGALFELHTNPSYVSMILLEPGETLSEIAAGDTARWTVTEASAETGVDPRAIVLVKPQTSGLRTNIVLITDRRTYLIEAVSQAGAAYAAQVAWSYPQSAVSPVSTSGIPSLDRLTFAYRVRTVRGRTPVWTPRKVFDDGRRTWIEFPSTIAAADMPPLFVITGEGPEIVNYRVQGQRIIVDRVFDRAELRLGARSPVIVRIDRQGARR